MAATDSINGSIRNQKAKRKVVFVMGATATGKSKLSIDLARHFNGEIINSDKIQFYKGLDIITNKVTEAEACGVPHYMLGFINDPKVDFTADDFCCHAIASIDAISDKGKLPIVAGGSNSYLERLIEDPKFSFRVNFDCLFIWLDVAVSTLYKRVGTRVDEMVGAGLVEEVRGMFFPDTDYTRGIWRAIGAPELHRYFMLEKVIGVDESTKMLEDAIEEIKGNTRKLVDSQLEKIRRLRVELGWNMHRIDATSVHQKRGKEAEEEWKTKMSS
ncbi:tRNA isopentenyltransferase [Corchorus olitorius]|uniref:adenylate dimethylallyltransferase (ADP/ATP-dependent) n=1 Tax=Corchorus olitorius TaxID=93759 RepID=A0A1R3HQN6_9ROSI|nr:tRNA isopentenyltransferase [Corchorus olitorius]